MLTVLMSIGLVSYAFDQTTNIFRMPAKVSEKSSLLWPEVFEENKDKYYYDDFFVERKPNDFRKGESNHLKCFGPISALPKDSKNFKEGRDLELPVELGKMETFENVPLQSEINSGGDSVYFMQEVMSRGNEESVIRGGMGSFLKIRSISIWGNGYWGGGGISPRNLPYSLDNDLKGASVGLNLKFRGNFTLSAYYNYNQGEVKAPTWQDTQTTNMAGLSLYYQSGNIYFTLLGTGGVDSYEYRKLSELDPLKFDGYQLNGYFEIGGNMTTGGLFTLKPFTSILYNYLSQDGFDSGSYVLLEDIEKKMDSFDYLAGARIDISPGSQMFTFQVRGAWVHQMDGGGDSINTFFMGRIPGQITPSQCFFEGYHGSDFFWGGAGVRFSMFNKLSLTLDYDLLTNKKQTSQFGNLGLLYHF